MEVTLVLRSGSSRVLTNLYSLVLQGSPQTEHGKCPAASSSQVRFHLRKYRAIVMVVSIVMGVPKNSWMVDFVENPKQKWRI